MVIDEFAQFDDNENQDQGLAPKPMTNDLAPQPPTQDLKLKYGESPQKGFQKYQEGTQRFQQQQKMSNDCLLYTSPSPRDS